MRNFVIRRPSPNEPKSLVIPFACAKGIAVMHDSSDITSALLSDGYGFWGFVTMKVTATGNASQLQTDAWLPGTNLEYDAKTNDTVTIVDALELEAEGSDLVMSTGVAAITTATATNTDLSFIDGKICAAQTGQQVYLKLVDATLTPDTDGNTRILAVRV